MSPIWKSLSRSVAGQPRRLCYRGGLPAFHSFSSSAMSNPYDESEEMPTAPSEKVLKIVEDISGLTLLEAADMSLLLKKKLKIHNVPVMSMGMNVVQDMWYETLPPPIGPKRMIPSRPAQRDVQPGAKVDELANAQSLSEDSEDYDGLGCQDFVDDELCAEVDEESIVKPTGKAKSATNARGGQTKRTNTKGAIPVVKKNSAATETTIAQETSSPAVKSTAKQGTAKQPKAATAIQKPAVKSPTPKAKPSTKKPEKAKPGAEDESVDSNT